MSLHNSCPIIAMFQPTQTLKPCSSFSDLQPAGSLRTDNQVLFDSAISIRGDQILRFVTLRATPVAE